MEEQDRSVTIFPFLETYSQENTSSRELPSWKTSDTADAPATEASDCSQVNIQASNTDQNEQEARIENLETALSSLTQRLYTLETQREELIVLYQQQLSRQESLQQRLYALEQADNKPLLQELTKRVFNLEHANEPKADTQPISSPAQLTALPSVANDQNTYFDLKQIQRLKALLQSFLNTRSKGDLTEILYKNIEDLLKDLCLLSTPQQGAGNYSEAIRTERLPQLFIDICRHAQRTNKEHITANMVNKNFKIFSDLGMSVIYPVDGTQPDRIQNEIVRPEIARDNSQRGKIANCLCPGLMVDGQVFAPAQVSIYS